MGKIKLGGIEVGAVLPIGSSVEMYGDAVPAGYLSCDGQEVAQASYPELFAVIGTTWDVTGGVAAPVAGNFRLPPQAIGGLGIFSRGVGAVAVGVYQADVFKAHFHYLTAQGCGDGANNRGTANYNGNNNWSSETVGDPTETRPRSITLRKCIYAGR